MAISKIILNGVIQMDVTGKTVTSASMRNGITALKNDGTDITGSIQDMTLPSAASSTSSGTAKATITPTSSAQYLNIPEGYNDTAQFYTIAAASGGSSWTKVAETSYQVSTTQTSAQTVATWNTGHSEIWTSAKFVYVRIRDTAGKRAGYFYGSDQIFLNYYPAAGTSNTDTTAAGRFYTNVNTSGNYSTTVASGTTGYGVFADQITSSGQIRIRSRYSSSTSRTINGTYKVEVYLLDPPTGAPIFT